MADNYLEKKMEEHRTGSRSQSMRPKHTPRGDRPGTLTIKLDSLRVLVVNVDNPYLEAVVKSLGSVGYKVGFTASDYTRGNRLAQLSSTLFYNNMSVGEAFGLMTEKWGGVDLIVCGNADMPALLSENSSAIIIDSLPLLPAISGRHAVNAVSTDNISPDDLARFVVYLTLPSSKFIRNKIFSF